MIDSPVIWAIAGANLAVAFWVLNRAGPSAQTASEFVPLVGDGDTDE